MVVWIKHESTSHAVQLKKCLNHKLLVLEKHSNFITFNCNQICCADCRYKLWACYLLIKLKFVDIIENHDIETFTLLVCYISLKFIKSFFN